MRRLYIIVVNWCWLDVVKHTFSAQEFTGNMYTEGSVILNLYSEEALLFLFAILTASVDLYQ